ncbi:hypothetical protein ACFOPN_03835 [Xanthomonas hyacinthi]|uniref:hypothetical protein n=1 Tax=Xanthomonas hyacinthi TaxID=56455 RepID=UPI003606BAEE
MTVGSAEVAADARAAATGGGAPAGPLRMGGGADGAALGWLPGTAAASDSLRASWRSSAPNGPRVPGARSALAGGYIKLFKSPCVCAGRLTQLDAAVGTGAGAERPDRVAF